MRGIKLYQNAAPIPDEDIRYNQATLEKLHRSDQASSTVVPGTEEKEQVLVLVLVLKWLAIVEAEHSVEDMRIAIR